MKGLIYQGLLTNCTAVINARPFRPPNWEHKCIRVCERERKEGKKGEKVEINCNTLLKRVIHTCNIIMLQN